MAQALTNTHPTALASPAFLRALPRWLHYRTLALAWTALLVYGTLLPFDFNLATSWEQAGGFGFWLFAFLTSPRWIEATQGAAFLGSAAAVDLIINLALYGPLGICLRLDFGRRGWRVPGQMFATALSLASVSYLLECGQSLEASRVASLYDVAGNAAGGLIAAAAAPAMKRAVEAMVFWTYRRSGRYVPPLRRFFVVARRRPLFVVAMILVDAVLIIVWVLLAGAWRVGGAGGKLPFVQAHALPYDLAAMQLGRIMAVYFLIAMLLSIQFVQLPMRRRMRWLVLAVAVLALLREIVGHDRPGPPDLTEPVLALIAAGLIIIAAHLVAHAVRRSCRRRASVPIAVDRRR